MNWIVYKLKTSDQRKPQNILGNMFSQYNRPLSDKGLVVKIYKDLLTVEEEKPTQF